MGKYEDALERARQGKPIDEVFPELKESEDERTLEWIIGIVNACKTLSFKDKVKLTRYLERQKEQKPAEWSEEDKDKVAQYLHDRDGGMLWSKATEITSDILDILRPQPKQEREPMEIKFGGKIYQVHGVRTLPGGITGYIIEDEPGHYDCIFKPEEVLGGGYGVKQNGSPYPTKDATFDCLHWKPTKEQMRGLVSIITALRKDNSDDVADFLESLYHNLEKLM